MNKSQELIKFKHDIPVNIEEVRRLDRNVKPLDNLVRFAKRDKNCIRKLPDIF